MGTTDLAVRRTLDLTRAPEEQWNDEMVKLVAAQVFRGREVTKGELYFCLSVADGVGLNPMIGEIYFIPAKSKNAQGPTYTPYIGRNGLVAKATERAAYYEAEVVHENDRFKMTRKRDGTVEVTHSYGGQDRGAIIGAYAFLHFRNGDRPAFSYAKVEEYLPDFDADWKWEASPWGEKNQRSEMIKKVAMIQAGRQRLNLGNVLADGEIERVLQQGNAGPRQGEPAPAEPFGYEALPCSEETRDRLRAAVRDANEVQPMMWTEAKLEMMTAGLDAEGLAALAERIETDAAAAREGEEVVDAEPVPDPEPAAAPPDPETDARAKILQNRIATLYGQQGSVEPGGDADRQIQEEIDMIGAELAALGNPDQGSLL